MSDALKDEVYRIRHKVYCEELAFEPQRPNGREHDEYDAHSLHLLIRNVKSGEFMGCTRLVLTRPEEPDHSLPFEKLCAATLDRSIVDPAMLPRNKIAELSRLAVLARFRSPKGAAGSTRQASDAARPRFPYILACLYLGTIKFARLNGIDTVFALTDERLLRHLRLLGIRIDTIGGPVEHRGRRLPSMMSPSAIINDLDIMVRPFYRKLAAEIRQPR